MHTYDTIRYDTVRYGTMRYDTIRYDTIRYDTIRYDTIRYDTLRYVTLRYITLEFQRRSLTQYFPNVEVKLIIYIKTMFDQQMRCFTLLVSVQI